MNSPVLRQAEVEKRDYRVIGKGSWYQEREKRIPGLTCSHTQVGWRKSRFQTCIALQSFDSHNDLKGKDMAEIYLLCPRSTLSVLTNIYIFGSDNPAEPGIFTHFIDKDTAAQRGGMIGQQSHRWPKARTLFTFLRFKTRSEFPFSKLNKSLIIWGH